jgi:hypothetical protein
MTYVCERTGNLNTQEFGNSRCIRYEGSPKENVSMYDVVPCVGNLMGEHFSVSKTEFPTGVSILKMY